MGSLPSRIRLIYQTLKSISDSFAALSARISLDPGLPIPNPSRSYWCVPQSSLDSRESKEDPSIPAYADVVIIGSGIAGTAIARTLLASNEDTPLRVVMLEARDVCSGATGRNGGHISPNSYQDYFQLAAAYGASAAQAIIRFRLAHLPALLAVAEEEGLLQESQTREVEQLDVFLHDTLFGRAKDLLSGYLNALPDRREKHRTYDDESVLRDLQLTGAKGCISQTGGALHPYRLVTGILSRLLTTYPSFQLFTRTPCTSIVSPGNGAQNSNYVLSTPRGTVSTPHVVHATNAWAAHLLPGMRRKIVPMRAHMTAQRPGRGLGAGLAASSWAGTRAFVFYPGTALSAFDYLTQQPVPAATTAQNETDSGSINTSTPTEYPPPAGEFMFGGGALLGGSSDSAALENIGIADDGKDDFSVTAYLGGALERYFADAWGAEADGNGDGGPWATGRVKAMWTGVLGFSADGQPWVGRIPPRISERVEPSGLAISKTASAQLVRPGEWIAAGFTGEGMTHAWLAGVALARMLVGPPAIADRASEPEVQLPPQFLITEKRWQEADFETFLGDAAE
ncbi:FAD dependent oxidoreductase [Mycena epipterygia]|nr:FAD dependent oxidoreductase [Mycena epipterygia]